MEVNLKKNKIFVNKINKVIDNNQKYCDVKESDINNIENNDNS